MSLLEYAACTAENTGAKNALTDCLYNVDWSYVGNCPKCGRSFGPNPEDEGPCKYSRPTPIDSIELYKDTELVDVLADLGGATFSAYLEKTGWTSSDPRERRDLWCSRCTAFSNFVGKFGSSLEDRFVYVQKGVQEGLKDLREVPPPTLTRTARCDLLLTDRFRCIVGAVREAVRESSVVCVTASSNLHGYMIAHLLCLFSQVWLDDDRCDGEVKSSSIAAGGGGVPAAFVHSRTSMDKLAANFHDHLVRVVVVCQDLPYTSLPKELVAACGHAVCWDQYTSPPLGMSPPSFQVLWKKEEVDLASLPADDDSGLQQTCPLARPVDLPDEVQRIRDRLTKVWLKHASDSYSVAEFLGRGCPLTELPGQLAVSTSCKETFAEQIRETEDLWRQSGYLLEEEYYGDYTTSAADTSVGLGAHTARAGGARADEEAAAAAPDAGYEIAGQAGFLPFDMLHSVDLGQPRDKPAAGQEDSVLQGWPNELLLFRLESAEQPKLSSFAFLSVLPDVLNEHRIPFFGYALEFGELPTEHRFSVRVKPTVLNWAAERWKLHAKYREESEPEQVLRDFSEAKLLSLLPHCRPIVGQALDRRPTSSLVVRIKEDSGDDVCFDWDTMKQDIQEQQRKDIEYLLDESCGCDDSRPVSDADGADDDDGKCLVAVARRFFDLRDFEAASLRYGPISPPLTPLALEGVLVSSQKEKYRALGAKVLALLGAIACHCKHPDGHWKSFEKRAATWMPRKTFARLVWTALPRGLLALAVSRQKTDWTPPGVRCEAHSSDEGVVSPSTEELACIGEAFLGAYFASEGGLLSCWLFLEWLQSRSGEPVALWPAEHTAALGHLLFGGCQPFRGRTPSYHEFQEICDPADPERDVVLRVNYADSTSPVREYRRANLHRRCPEERVGGNGSDWVPLMWSYKRQTYCSADDEDRCVPNKVLSWLKWKPAAPLVTVRAYTARGARLGRDSFDRFEMMPPPEYTQLQERRNGDLRVKYKDPSLPWFVYSRSKYGNLGSEMRENSGEQPMPLKYSERLKTLLSPLLEQPLPNKITEAVHHHKNLVLIVTPKHSEFEELQRVIDCSHVHQGDRNGILWEFREEHLGTTASWNLILFVETTQDGVVFVEKHDDGVTQELIYSEELKTWLSPALTKALEKTWDKGVPVHPIVLDYLKQGHQKMLQECASMAKEFRKHYFREPWRNVPYFIKAMAPRCSIQVGDIEGQILMYSFQNPMLLVESMTHVSFDKAATPSNERLANIGKHLLETLLAQEIIRGAGIDIKSPPIFGEDTYSAPALKTFALAGRRDGVDKVMLWPEVAPQTTSALDHSLWKELLSACCNHLIFAVACCACCAPKVRLCTHILRTSPELDDAIADFRAFADASGFFADETGGSTVASDDSDHAADASSRSSRRTLRWAALMAKDAPRALSDAFLAIAAAVFLDSDWITFCRVFIDRNGPIGQCLGHLFTEVLPDVKASVLDPVAHLKGLVGEGSLEMSVRALDLSRPPAAVSGDGVAQVALQTALLRDPYRGKCLNKKALKSGKEAASIEVAASLRDLHFCQLHIGDLAVGPFVSAASPRSAERRCAAFALQGEDLEKSAEHTICTVRDALESAASTEEAREAVQRRLEGCGIAAGSFVRCPQGPAALLDESGELGIRAEPLQEAGVGPELGADGSKVAADGSIYCPVCDMWVNGQGQYDDHRNGKKHKKNLLKDNRGSREALKEAKILPDSIAGKDAPAPASPSTSKDDAVRQRSSADSAPGLDPLPAGAPGGVHAGFQRPAAPAAADKTGGRGEFPMRGGQMGWVANPPAYEGSSSSEMWQFMPPDQFAGHPGRPLVQPGAPYDQQQAAEWQAPPWEGWNVQEQLLPSSTTSWNPHHENDWQ